VDCRAEGRAEGPAAGIGNDAPCAFQPQLVPFSSPPTPSPLPPVPPEVSAATCAILLQGHGYAMLVDPAWSMAFFVEPRLGTANDDESALLNPVTLLVDRPTIW